MGAPHMFDFDALVNDHKGKANQHIADIDERGQCLTFFLGDCVFGIDIKHVREILEFKEFLSIPAVPEFFRGVMDLRGRPIPIIDLSVRFHNKLSEITKFTCIVIVNLETDNGQLEMGLIIDNVKEVIELDQNNLQDAPSFGNKIDTKFISGMTKVDDKFVVILDIDHVLPQEHVDIVSSSIN